MKKLALPFMTILLSLTSIGALSSCSLAESGSISDFVGTYISGTGYERVKHYYWGKTTTKSEKQIMESGCTVLIYPNKKVVFQYPNYGEIKEGKVRVYGDYVRFYDLPINSDYEFYLKSGHHLSYSYHEDKYGLEYDYVTRDAYLNYQGEVDESKSLPREDKGFIHIERMDETYEVADKNYVFSGFYGHFRISGQNADGSPLDSSAVTVNWSSSDVNIAKVDYKGVVEARAAGTVTLKAQCGNYTDQIELHTGILATKFETTELADEYRGGNKYQLPFSFSPYNATVEIKTNDTSVIKLNEDKKTFNVLKGGSALIIAEYYAWPSGTKTTKEVSINALDELAPHFEHDNRTMTGAKISVAKNQYRRIEPEKLDIHAYSSTGVDITEEIIIESGEYNLFQEGTYQVVLKVSDALNREARFNLTLEVTEFETKKYDSTLVFSGIKEVSHNVTPNSIPYSLGIKEIDFTMTIALDDSYDTADLEVTWLIYFKIKRWDDSIYVDHTEEGITVKEYSFVKDGPNTLEMNYRFSYPNYLDPKTLTEVSQYASVKGTYYQYVYYK